METLPLRRNVSPSTRPAEKPNFAGFDALRAFSALAVVLLHACVPYLQHPMPGLAWTVRDRTSGLLDCLFWGIESFIMPIFLVLAGFLAWQTLSKKGPSILVSSRARRLLVPLAFAVCVVLPIGLYTWVLAWVAEGVVAPVKLKSLKFDGVIDQDLWGLSHLWFMLYLFLYVMVAAIVFRGISQSRKATVLRRSLAQPHLVSIGLFLVAFVVLAFRPEVVWGFQHAFAPVPSKWIYSGTFFAGGMLLASKDPRLVWIQSKTPVLGIASVALLVTAVTMGRWHLQFSGDALAKGFLAAITVLCAWSTTLFLIAASGSFQKLSLPIQYLAAASFWIYLVHHPILGLTHLDLKLTLADTPPTIKTAMAFATSVTVSVLSYEVMVRRTRLGRLLGMTWEVPLSRPSVPELQSPLLQSDERESQPWSRAA
ncbi:acyltransferase family protein [Novipirellula artificiosorum]|uniref:Glucans biosynthesis protein n=1 Tax=Novipirellula artificiosorum TaxID=2528016 RepID=A0A5C6DE57_9BACT|nr:acyltransferase [Novipirellula artificiosorum]TWU35080.1 glucans biosynthesis protein [Novipirellula artificiosorum]